VPGAQGIETHLITNWCQAGSDYLHFAKEEPGSERLSNPRELGLTSASKWQSLEWASAILVSKSLSIWYQDRDSSSPVFPHRDLFAVTMALVHTLSFLLRLPLKLYSRLIFHQATMMTVWMTIINVLVWPGSTLSHLSVSGTQNSAQPFSELMNMCWINESRSSLYAFPGPHPQVLHRTRETMLN
jgi:hypothetical protein